MKTKNDYIIIQKRKLQSESGIVRGQPQPTGFIRPNDRNSEGHDVVES